MAQHELEKTLQIGRRAVRVNTEFLGGLIETVHPDRRIAERLRAGGIPSPKCRKQDVLLRPPEKP